MRLLPETHRVAGTQGPHLSTPVSLTCRETRGQAQSHQADAGRSLPGGKDDTEPEHATGTAEPTHQDQAGSRHPEPWRPRTWPH